MSEVKTDKLSPRTASGTVTLGTSGDTFTIPSGVTLTNNGSSSGFDSGLASVQTFTSSGTWTKPSGITKINITIIGGGAGGGGATNQYGAGSGGAGSTVIKYAHNVSSISTATITIGSGGAGVLSAAGTNGGTSTYVDSALTLTAGGGDSGQNTYGTATGGDVNIQGVPGDSPHFYGYNLGSKGGSTILGEGGNMRYYEYTGTNGTGYGSGGGGGGRQQGTGGSGASGICIIEEYK